MLANASNFHKTVVIFLACCGLNAQAHDFAGGTGDPNDPYQIATAAQLVAIGSDPNLLDKHFVLVNDIDLDPNLPGGRVFTGAVIAPDTDDTPGFQGIAFAGCLDGHGHTIRHLMVKGETGDFLGLFGRIGYFGRVYRLGLENVIVVGGNGSSCLGGLAGQNWGDIVCCQSIGHVSAGDSSSCLGGLVGWNAPGCIIDCLAAGTVTAGAGSQKVGGLAGFHGGWYCEAEGQCFTAAGRITRCFAAARVSAGHTSSNLGGLVGRTEHAAVVGHCFWDVQASGLSGSAGGTGLSTPEMRDAGPFLAEGWDLAGERGNGTADIWLVPEGGGQPVLTLVGGYEPRQLAGGGTLEDPYLIATTEDLGAIHHHDWSACYRLTNDLDLAGITWSAAPICYFQGHLDGAGHTVYHLTIRGDIRLGLFAIVGTCATVTNLEIKDANVVGEEDSWSVGILAGWNEGNVIDCRTSGTISAYRSAGGLVGGNRFGTIRRCQAFVDVSGRGEFNDSMGGLVGYNFGEILDSRACGNVTGSYGVAGLVASNEGTISGCCASGTVTSDRLLGGLVAYNWMATIVDCYAIGSLLPHNQKPESGGLVGENYDGAIRNCYAMGSLVGTQTVGGSTVQSFFLAPPDANELASMIGMPLTDEQMKHQASFTGWDFENTWMICEGKGYPHLQWEKIDCGQP